MGYLDELKPRLAFDRWDYVRALRALLPRGILWNIPLPNESNIRPNSILSGEQFGRVTISSEIIYITPDGIAGAEDFGLAIVIAHNIIEMSGIPSGEAFGQPTVLTNEQFLTMLSIASAEGWGSPTIKPAFVHFCDFSVDLCPGFDIEFYANWYQITEHDEGIAQSGASDVISKLYPVSGFTGDFLLEFGIWKSFPIDPASATIHMFLFSTDTDNMFYEVKLMTSIGTQPYISANGASYPITTSPTEYNLRIIRVAGVIWSYIWDWDGSAWLRLDAWPTPGSEMIYSGACYFKVSGTEAANGFSYISINGAVA